MHEAQEKEAELEQTILSKHIQNTEQEDLPFLVAALVFGWDEETEHIE